MDDNGNTVDPYEVAAVIVLLLWLIYLQAVGPQVSNLELFLSELAGR